LRNASRASAEEVVMGIFLGVSAARRQAGPPSNSTAATKPSRSLIASPSARLSPCLVAGAAAETKLIAEIRVPVLNRISVYASRLRLSIHPGTEAGARFIGVYGGFSLVTSFAGYQEPERKS
jgi:hypothetical protein